MGCGSSKLHNGKVRPTTTEKTSPLGVTAQSADPNTTDKEIKQEGLSRPLLPQIKPIAGDTISKNVLPKPISFDIPLNTDTFIGKAKLAGIRHDVMNAKLANSEDRWKEMEAAEEEACKRKAKSREPDNVKAKLDEKDAAASENRRREHERKQLKKIKQAEHQARVLERKRLAELDGGNGAIDDIRVSVGTQGSSVAESGSENSVNKN